MDAGLVEGLGVHLREKPPVPGSALAALMGPAFPQARGTQDPELSPPRVPWG